MSSIQLKGKLCTTLELKKNKLKLCNTQTTTKTVIDMNFLPRQKQNLLSLETILNSSILLKLLKFDIGIFDSLRMERTLPDQIEKRKKKFYT